MNIHLSGRKALVSGSNQGIGLASAAGAELLHTQVPELDILVNHLGIFAQAALLEIDDHEWRRCFEVNELSAVRRSRTYLPGIIERGWGGSSRSPANPRSSSRSRWCTTA